MTRVLAWLLLFSPLASYAQEAAEQRGCRLPLPVHAWFQPPMLERRPDLYRYMTVATSLTDAAAADVCKNRGVVALRWCFGPVSEHSEGKADFYCRQCDPTIDGVVRFAGVGIDEWDPGNKRFAAERDLAAAGYRAARRRWPDNIMIAWVTRADDVFVELLRDGTFDLAIIEGYTFIPDVGGVTIEEIMERCDIFGKAGLLDRTIVCFGYISAKRDSSGRAMTIDDLERNVQLVKKKHPQMPGVAFYGFSDGAAETLELIRQADALSERCYPHPCLPPAKASQ